MLKIQQKSIHNQIQDISHISLSKSQSVQFQRAHWKHIQLKHSSAPTSLYFLALLIPYLNNKVFSEERGESMEGLPSSLAARRDWKWSKSHAFKCVLEQRWIIDWPPRKTLTTSTAQEGGKASRSTQEVKELQCEQECNRMRWAFTIMWLMNDIVSNTYTH